MAIFGKREVIFKAAGDKARCNQAKEALKAAGIKIMEAGSHEGEMPLCSCGAKIDRRNYGPKGWIDRRVYYLAVRPEDAAAARSLLLETVGEPLIKDSVIEI